MIEPNSGGCIINGYTYYWYYILSLGVVVGDRIIKFLATFSGLCFVLAYLLEYITLN